MLTSCQSWCLWRLINKPLSITIEVGEKYCISTAITTVVFARAFGTHCHCRASLTGNGYEKLYVKNADVKHSHDYDANSIFERWASEAEFFILFWLQFSQYIQCACKGIYSDLQDDLKEGKQLDCSDEQILKRASNVYAKHLGWLNGVNRWCIS